MEQDVKVAVQPPDPASAVLKLQMRHLPAPQGRLKLSHNLRRPIEFEQTWDVRSGGIGASDAA